jgi:hypothetical protein
MALLIAGLVAGLALGSYGIATAVTASNASTSKAGAMGGPGGPGHGRGGMRGGADLAAVVAKLTGISETDVRTQRAAGKSFEAIAKTKGVSASKVVEKALADAKTVMDAEVKVGRLTSAQEAQMLADMKTRFQAEMTATTTQPDGGMGKGMRGGGGLASAVASLTATSVDDVMAQRAAGKSFAQIAAAKGVSASAVVDKALATATSELKTRFESEIDATGTAGPGGFGGGPGGQGGPGGPGGGF